MSDITRVLKEQLGTGAPLILVTVAAVRGSAPRGTGARMLVSAERTWGTVGGGTLEHRCAAEARSMLGRRNAPSLMRFDPQSGVDQACGGAVDVLFECLDDSDRERVEALYRLGRAGPLVRVVGVEGPAAGRWLLVSAEESAGSLGPSALDSAASDASRALLARASAHCATELRTVSAGGVAAVLLLDPMRGPAFDVFLFGAGHVGRALATVLGQVDCRITWIDSRRDAFPESVPPNVRAMHAAIPERFVDLAPEGAFVLVMTHSHDGDFAIVERALARDDLAFVGMIGSLPKRNRFVQSRGIGTPLHIDRLTCPIGIAGIHGKEPATIAIAVAAQLLQIRDAREAAERTETTTPGYERRTGGPA